MHHLNVLIERVLLGKVTLAIVTLEAFVALTVWVAIVVATVRMV